MRYVCCGQRSDDPRSQRAKLSRAASGANAANAAGTISAKARAPACGGGPLAVPEQPPVRRRQRLARLPDRQPDHRRRRRRARLAQQLGELEHVGDLLTGPRPVAIQGHRQRELVEPRRPPAPERPDAEEPEDPRQAERQQHHAAPRRRTGTTSRGRPARPPSRPARPPRRRRTPGRAGAAAARATAPARRAGPAAPRGGTRAWAVPSRSTRFRPRGSFVRITPAHSLRMNKGRFYPPTDVEASPEAGREANSRDGGRRRKTG